ncbi:hypothetical protein Si024_00232 [Streptococcus infantarius subsp. infantarius]|nr:hypothetical protein [Streptococcus infantarius subsp. infantarius]
MTNNFKEADEIFQELMKKVNNKLIGLDSVAISDNNAEKCKKNKDLSWYEKDNIISPNHYVSDNGIKEKRCRRFEESQILSREINRGGV